jgi:hypothetical protein
LFFDVPEIVSFDGGGLVFGVVRRSIPAEPHKVQLVSLDVVLERELAGHGPPP